MARITLPKLDLEVENSTKDELTTLYSLAKNLSLFMKNQERMGKSYSKEEKKLKEINKILISYTGPGKIDPMKFEVLKEFSEKYKDIINNTKFKAADKKLAANFKADKVKAQKETFAKLGKQRAAILKTLRQNLYDEQQLQLNTILETKAKFDKSIFEGSGVSGKGVLSRAISPDWTTSFNTPIKKIVAPTVDYNQARTLIGNSRDKAKMSSYGQDRFENSKFFTDQYKKYRRNAANNLHGDYNFFENSKNILSSRRQWMRDNPLNRTVRKPTTRENASYNFARGMSAPTFEEPVTQQPTLLNRIRSSAGGAGTRAATSMRSLVIFGGIIGKAIVKSMSSRGSGGVPDAPDEGGSGGGAIGGTVTSLGRGAGRLTKIMRPLAIFGGVIGKSLLILGAVVTAVVALGIGAGLAMKLIGSGLTDIASGIQAFSNNEIKPENVKKNASALMEVLSVFGNNFLGSMGVMMSGGGIKGLAEGLDTFNKIEIDPARMAKNTEALTIFMQGLGMLGKDAGLWDSIVGTFKGIANTFLGSGNIMASFTNFENLFEGMNKLTSYDIKTDVLKNNISAYKEFMTGMGYLGDDSGLGDAYMTAIGSFVNIGKSLSNMVGSFVDYESIFGAMGRLSSMQIQGDKLTENIGYLKQFFRSLGIGGSEGVGDSLLMMLDGFGGLLGSSNKIISNFIDMEKIFDSMEKISNKTYNPDNFEKFRDSMRMFSKGINAFDWNTDIDWINADKVNSLTTFIEKMNGMTFDPTNARKTKEGLVIMSEGLQAMFDSTRTKGFFGNLTDDGALTRLITFDKTLSGIVTSMEKLAALSGSQATNNSLYSPMEFAKSYTGLNGTNGGLATAAAKADISELMRGQSMAQIPGMIMSSINNNTLNSSKSTIQVKTSVDRNFTTKDFIYGGLQR